MRPVDGITLDEAARICGCSRRTLVRHIETGRLLAAERHVKRRVSRAEAEALALPGCRARGWRSTPDTEHWAKVVLQRMLDLPGKPHRD